MKVCSGILQFVVCGLLFMALGVNSADIQWQSFSLKPKGSGGADKAIAGQMGYLPVKLNHQDSNSPMVELTVVKLPTTASKPVAPIVYLAGGPGGSALGAAQGKRFSLFSRLREVADVIIFEQRGTGKSRHGLKHCHYPTTVPLEQHFTRQTLQQEIIRAGEYCNKQWQQQGIDLNAYTTMQSAADLETLRVALAAKKLNLWGISYGTHLAMAMAKYYPTSIERMVLASSEGLDQTVKLPKYSDNHLKRVAKAISQDQQAAAKYPDLIALMSQVHEKYRKQPIVIEYQDKRSQQQVKLGISDVEIQLLTAYILGKDREQLAMLPAAYTGMLYGQFQQLAPYFHYLKQHMWRLNPMSIAMDSASGISKTRWQHVQTQGAQAILWRAHNLPIPDIKVAVKDLGEGFRQPFNSDIPALFLAGDLDGRTFIEAQRINAQQFNNHVFITINHVGHNLLMSTPSVTERMLTFFKGGLMTDETIELPNISFM